MKFATTFVAAVIVPLVGDQFVNAVAYPSSFFTVAFAFLPSLPDWYHIPPAWSSRLWKWPPPERPGS